VNERRNKRILEYVTELQRKRNSGYIAWSDYQSREKALRNFKKTAEKKEQKNINLDRVAS